jgi:hypothetical protein
LPLEIDGFAQAALASLIAQHQHTNRPTMARLGFKSFATFSTAAEPPAHSLSMLDRYCPGARQLCKMALSSIPLHLLTIFDVDGTLSAFQGFPTPARFLGRRLI